MTSHDPPRTSPEEDAAALLEQVMRGERFIWLPPGGLVVSLLIPCLCLAAVPLALLATAAVLPLHDSSAGLARFLVPLGVAIAIVAVASAGQVLMVFGRAAASRGLSWYVRGLLVAALLLTGALLLGWIEAPWPLPIVAIVALLACHRILGSWSYAAVTAFFSLKRDYRLRAQARRGGSCVAEPAHSRSRSNVAPRSEHQPKSSRS